MPNLSESDDKIRKPSRSRYNHDGDALERDTKEGLEQILSGLPCILNSKRALPDKRGNTFKIDLIVMDGKSSRPYAIIECKNIHSNNPYTNEVELLKAAHLLSYFRNDRALKICVVNRRRRLSDAAKKKIDHFYRFQVKGKVYDWSTELDWLKMAYTIRKAILRYHKSKETIRFCSRLISYGVDELLIEKRKRRKFLLDIGVRNAHGMVHAYDKMKKKF